MKYRAKFSAEQYGVTQTVIKGDTYESESFFNGVIVFIPFTDTNFFEPVKTRKFEIEVSEEHMDRFDSLVNDGFEPWTVTEITLPFWVIKFKSQYPEATIDSYEGIDPIWIKKTFIDRKLEALKWIKTHTNCGLVSAKHLTDYIWITF